MQKAELVSTRSRQIGEIGPKKGGEPDEVCRRRASKEPRSRELAATAPAGEAAEGTGSLNPSCNLHTDSTITCSNDAMCQRCIEAPS